MTMMWTKREIQEASIHEEELWILQQEFEQIRNEEDEYDVSTGTWPHGSYTPHFENETDNLRMQQVNMATYGDVQYGYTSAVPRGREWKRTADSAVRFLSGEFDEPDLESLFDRIDRLVEVTRRPECPASALANLYRLRRKADEIIKKLENKTKTTR